VHPVGSYCMTYSPLNPLEKAHLQWQPTGKSG